MLIFFQHHYNLLQFPIKSLNCAVKAYLAGAYPGLVKVQGKGITYKEHYFDFRVTKAIKNFMLSDSSVDFQDEIIHINQITDEQIFLCVVFRNHIQVFILDDAFFTLFNSQMTQQHNKYCFQLHLAYKDIADNCSLKMVF